MSKGEIQSNGLPVVECYLTLPRFGLTRHMTFLVDTGAYATCIHPRDGRPVRIPFGQLESSVISDGVGGAATYFREKAVLEFVDAEEMEIRTHEVEVLIAKPDNNPNHSINRPHSLLGRGVIDRWRMLYDRTDNLLEFTIKRS